MSPHIPPELYYPIFALLPTDTLVTLAHTSRLTQHPAEALIYRAVEVAGRERIGAFCGLVRPGPGGCRGGRLGPLVRRLRICGAGAGAGVANPRESSGIDDSDKDENEEWERYWSGVRDALGTMRALEVLEIDVGRDEMLGWVLREAGLGSSLHLKRLKCGFALDGEFMRFLATQTRLEELSWTGNPHYICYDDSCEASASIRSSEKEKENENENDRDTAAFASAHPCATTSFLLSHLPAGSLPRLRTLQTESPALARALVPGRPVRHLWVPGAHYASAERTRMEVAFVYGHVSVGAWAVPAGSRVTEEGDVGAATERGRRRRRRYPWVARALAPTGDGSTSGAQATATDTQTAARLCAAIRDFGRSTGPIVSLRLCLGLASSVALCEVFACMAREMPELRSLGFVPGFKGEVSKQGVYIHCSDYLLQHHRPRHRS